MKNMLLLTAALAVVSMTILPDELFAQRGQCQDCQQSAVTGVCGIPNRPNQNPTPPPVPAQLQSIRQDAMQAQGYNPPDRTAYLNYKKRDTQIADANTANTKQLIGAEVIQATAQTPLRDTDVALLGICNKTQAAPQIIEGTPGRDGLDGRDGANGKDGKDGATVKEVLDQLDTDAIANKAGDRAAASVMNQLDARLNAMQKGITDDLTHYVDQRLTNVVGAQQATKPQPRKLFWTVVKKDSP